MRPAPANVKPSPIRAARSQRRLAAAAEPDRDRAGRAGGDAGPVDAVEPAPVVHDRLRPQPAQQLDLLVEALAPPLPRHAEAPRTPRSSSRCPTPRRSRPPDSTSTSAACLATSAVWRWGRMITAGLELDRRGHPGEEAEQHERLVERVLLGVGAPQLGLPALVDGAEDVVVGDDVAEAEPLGGLGVVADGDRVVADLGGGEHGSELHGVILAAAPTGRRPNPPGAAQRRARASSAKRRTAVCGSPKRRAAVLTSSRCTPASS